MTVASRAPGPMIKTDRLTLRPMRLEDFDAYAAFMADPVTRFVGGPQSRPEAWRGFAFMAGQWALTGVSMFSVIETATGAWVGRVGPWRPEGWPGREVGWGIVSAAQGKGYAAEAAAAAMDYAFDVLGWTEVIHTIDPANHASVAVARKLGSTNGGPVRLPPPIDVVVDAWGQTAAQWRRMGRHPRRSP